MYPVDSGKGRAVVVITYLAKDRPKASQAPEDLLYMDIQVGPREETKLRLGAYTVDPEFGQIGRCIIPHEVEIEFEYNSSWATRMDCLKAGLVQVYFHFRGWKELLAAYVPKDKLPQLKKSSTAKPLTKRAPRCICISGAQTFLRIKKCFILYNQIQSDIVGYIRLRLLTFLI